LSSALAMMLVPIGSDAPVYHFPWGTIALIGLNTLVQLAISMGLLPPIEELAAGYALVHGEGLHPMQWVTSNFLHADWAHLLGNMVFLWAFGLIVEGKIGWRRFVAAYLGIGVAECFIEQLLLPSSPPSLGASSIIFGLMMMAVVWAPKNDVEMWYAFGLPPLFRIGTFDVPVLWLCGLLVAKEVAFAMWYGWTVGSELFHLLGAGLGFGVGASMLKAKLVDCEGWDLWTVLKGAHRGNAVLLHSDAAVLDGRSAELAALSPDEEKQKQSQRKIRALGRVTALLNEGRAVAALGEVRQTQQVLSDFRLGERDLLRLGEALYDAGQWREAVEVFNEFIERFPKQSDLVRLLTANVMVKQQRRPTAAMRHLREVDRERLPPRYHTLYDDTRAAAERLIDEGVIELEGQAWG
jgi:membrane associated rhomboid family serine protease